jgi:flagellin
MNVVAHNLSAMNAQRQFGINTGKRAKSTEKLSSGYKINRAADNAAGLAISEKMRRQIRGLTQGVENTQDGVSLCQVADGALAEVNDMLHRITELSVQAANGTNTEADRRAIQEEINQILKEIDRIGDTTTFNEQPIFKGSERYVLNADGTPAGYDSIDFDDFKLADVSLGKTPIRANEGADMLHLQAIVDNDDLAMNGKTFNLIFGNGSTSDSSLRITDSAGNKSELSMKDMTISNFSTNGSDEWSRDFTYSSGAGEELTITQKVKLDESAAEEKKYVISYDFAKSAGITNVEFMFHVDTAYNNNDTCEGYFIDGNRVDKFCVYNQDAGGSDLTNGSASAYVYNGNVPDSFSIVDVDSALAFSEKISFGSREPDSLSIGRYSQIKNWSYYDSLDKELGRSTDKRDLGFCLYYDMGDLSQDSSVSFNYGIASTEKDPNLKNVLIEDKKGNVEEHLTVKSVWIQSGTEAGSGMDVIIDEMNTGVLGIQNLNVSTVSGAKRTMEATKGALQKVSANRARIGAQQNRLEHIIANEENIVENTTAAESRIRDTDMAKEMVRYSNLNILEQVGHAMMAQANQSNQGVLNLLQ